MADALVDSSTLPPHTVRESRRAKRVILRVTAKSGLEVVVPSGFDTTRIPAILSGRAEWVESVFRRMERKGITPGAPPSIPSEIFLEAIGECWRLDVVSRADAESRLTQKGPQRLLLVDGEADASRKLVRKWLAARGRETLVPWLRELSAETGLTFERAQIRGQKTRWGSCSARGTISINFNILFLPEELARYVLIHELCHTRHMDHSERYWALVARFEPRWYELDRALGASGSRVPLWLG